MKDKYRIWINSDVRKKGVKFLPALEAPFPDKKKLIILMDLGFLYANLFTFLIFSFELNGKVT